MKNKNNMTNVNNMIDTNDMSDMNQFDLTVETLWSVCYDASWFHYAITGKIRDFWGNRRWYLTDEVSPAAEITCPTW